MKKIITFISLAILAQSASAEFVFTSELYKKNESNDSTVDSSWVFNAANGYADDTDTCDGIRISSHDQDFAFARASYTDASNIPTGVLGAPEGWRVATPADFDSFDPKAAGTHDFHMYYYNICGNIPATGSIWPRINGIPQYYFALANSEGRLNTDHFVHAGQVQGYYNDGNLSSVTNFAGFILVKK